MTNNMSYCLSQYLKNDYNIELDEHSSFVLGSTLGLHLLPRHEHISIDTAFSDLSKYYISPTNPMWIASFSNTMNFILSIQQHNTSSQMFWMLEETLLNNKKKFLVSVSDRILNQSQKHDTPIYALVFFPPQPVPEKITWEAILTMTIRLQFTTTMEIDVSGQEFFDAWIIDNNEMFNANRYFLTPPTLQNRHNGTTTHYHDALTRQYWYMKLAGSGSGIDLLVYLRNRLCCSLSQSEINKHHELLRYSISKELLFKNEDMSRSYYGKCLLNLPGTETALYNTVSEKFSDAGDYWKQVHTFLLKNNTISHQDMVNIYDTLIDKESEAFRGLKNITLLWN